MTVRFQGGKHITERNAALPGEMISMLKSQDKNYIKTQREISKKVGIGLVLIIRSTADSNVYFGN